jgi:hypothetical protein
VELRVETQADHACGFIATLKTYQRGPSGTSR